jgi:hypothetical protein
MVLAWWVDGPVDGALGDSLFRRPVPVVVDRLARMLAGTVYRSAMIARASAPAGSGAVEVSELVGGAGPPAGHGPPGAANTTTVP